MKNKIIMYLLLLFFGVFFYIIINCPTESIGNTGNNTSSSSSSSTSSNSSSLSSSSTSSNSSSLSSSSTSSNSSSSLSSSTSSNSSSSLSSSASSNSSSSSSSSTSSNSSSSSSSSTSSNSSSQRANIIDDLNTDPSARGWSVSPVNCDWEWGTITGGGPIGAICYGTKIAGKYSNAMTYSSNYVQLGPLDLSGYYADNGFRMTFDIYLDIDGENDFARLEYSTDGINFTPVSKEYVSGYAYNYPNDNPDSWSPFAPQNWTTVTVDLGALGLNNQTTVAFRWAFSTSPTVVFYGVYIDNIDIGY